MIIPWSLEGSWYIFLNTPAHCDEMLQDAETLVCIADKLTEVSEAISDLHWNRVATAGGSLPPGIPEGPWTIPPQAEKDRFIARDLAIHTLAHVARLDATLVGPTATKSCSRDYAHAAADPSGFGAANSTRLFGDVVGGTSRYPNQQAIDLLRMRTLVEARLTFESHLLRASGRLLRDLIRASVFADLAGAEQRAAKTADPLRGNEVSWGLRDAENGTYNSLAHAARVVSGRWEIGPTVPDPQCAGIAASRLLIDAYGSDRSARHLDLPVSTPGKATASQLIRREIPRLCRGGRRRLTSPGVFGGYSPS